MQASSKGHLQRLGRDCARAAAEAARWARLLESGLPDSVPRICLGFPFPFDQTHASRHGLREDRGSWSADAPSNVPLAVVKARLAEKRPRDDEGAPE